MPIQTFAPDGITKIFDSDLVANGVCLGVFSIPSGGSLSKSFPSLVGTTLRVLSTSGSLVAGVTVSYPSGVPTVASSVVAYDREVVLWCAGSPTYMNGSGMQAVTPAGSIALSPSARGMAYRGKAFLHSTVASTGGPNNTGAIFSPAKYFGWSLMRIAAPSQPIGVVKLKEGQYVVPASGWFEVSPGLWQTAIRCFDTLPAYADTSWPALLTPEVWCFAASTSPQPGATAAIWDTQTGELAYDLLAGQLLNSDGELYYSYTGHAASYPRALPAGVPASSAGIIGCPNWSVTAQLSITSANNRRMGEFEACWTLSGAAVVMREYLWRVYRTDYDYSGPAADQDIYAHVVNLGIY